MKLQAIELLSELDVSVVPGASPEGCGPAVGPLLAVPADPRLEGDADRARIEAVRAAEGILASTDDLSEEMRLRASAALVAGLRGPTATPELYHCAVAHALPRVGLPDDDAAVTALWDAMHDRSRPFSVRVTCAESLMRTGGLRDSVRRTLPDAIRGLAQETAVAYDTRGSWSLRQTLGSFRYVFNPYRGELERLPDGAVLRCKPLPEAFAAAERYITPIVSHVRGKDGRLGLRGGPTCAIPLDLLYPATADGADESPGGGEPRGADSARTGTPR